MVEIRELVIQARLREDAEAGPDGSKPKKEGEEGEEDDTSAPPPDPEWVQKIVDRCLYEVQAWWREKNLR
jgi:Family of unknown function (DUF5908)